MSFVPIGDRTKRLSAAQIADLASRLPERFDFDLQNPLGSDLWVEWLKCAYEVDHSKADVVRNIVASFAMFDSKLASDVIDCVLDWDHREFLDACFLLKHRPESLSIVRIPKPLRDIARIEGSYKGPPLGAGELVLLFMVIDSSCSFGGKEDVSLMGEKWHVKKMYKLRIARMGTSASTCYGSSETAFKLASIDRTFGNKVTDDLLLSHSDAISKVFGSLEGFRKELKEECLKREFSNCVGICVFDPSKDVLEFHRKADIECTNPKQGRYRLQVGTFKHPVEKIRSAIGRLKEVLYGDEVRSTFFVSSHDDVVLKIVEIVSNGHECATPIQVEGLSPLPYTVVRVSIDVWNDCLHSGKDVPLPEGWSWKDRRAIK